MRIQVRENVITRLNPILYFSLFGFFCSALIDYGQLTLEILDAMDETLPYLKYCIGYACIVAMEISGRAANSSDDYSIGKPMLICLFSVIGWIGVLSIIYRNSVFLDENVFEKGLMISMIYPIVRILQIVIRHGE